MDAELQPGKQDAIDVSILTHLPIDKHKLLSLGRRELRSALSQAGWCRTKFLDLRPAQVGVARCYRYTPKPPVIKGDRNPNKLPSWDIPPVEDEIVEFEKLERFHSDEVMNSQPDKATISQRSKLDIDWFTILPKPHILTLPQVLERASESLFEHVLPFKPTHILNKGCVTLLKDQYARVSWWIPIQGSIAQIFPDVSFPHGFSFARFMVFSEDRGTQVGVTPPGDHIDRNIAWTPISLQALWEFLIQVRERNNFGPLTLSYMVKSRYCVYLTVGCDAPVAMRLRATLAAWKAPEGHDFRGVNDKYYLRLLRPCRLLLVDNKGNPLLTA